MVTVGGETIYQWEVKNPISMEITNGKTPKIGYMNHCNTTMFQSTP